MNRDWLGGIHQEPEHPMPDTDHPLLRPLGEFRATIDVWIDEQRTICLNLLEREMSSLEAISETNSTVVFPPGSEMKPQAARPQGSAERGGPPSSDHAPPSSSRRTTTTTGSAISGSSQGRPSPNARTAATADDNPMLRLEKLAKHLNDRLSKPRESLLDRPDSAVGSTPGNSANHSATNHGPTGPDKA